LTPAVIVAFELKMHKEESLDTGCGPGSLGQMGINGPSTISRLQVIDVV